MRQGIDNHDGILRATDVMIGGKRTSVFGHGDVDLGCASVVRGSGARAFAAECYPICALRARVEGLSAAAIESDVSEIDIFVPLTGNFDTVTLDHMKVNNIKLQVDHFVFRDGHGVMILASVVFTDVAFDSEPALIPALGQQHVSFAIEDDHFSKKPYQSGMTIAPCGRLCGANFERLGYVRARPTSARGCQVGGGVFYMNTQSNLPQCVQSLYLWSSLCLLSIRLTCRCQMCTLTFGSRQRR